MPTRCKYQEVVPAFFHRLEPAGRGTVPATLLIYENCRRFLTMTSWKPESVEKLSHPGMCFKQKPPRYIASQHSEWRIAAPSMFQLTFRNRLCTIFQLLGITHVFCARRKEFGKHETRAKYVDVLRGVAHWGPA
jgi:hypothetical protein